MRAEALERKENSSSITRCPTADQTGKQNPQTIQKKREKTKKKKKKRSHLLLLLFFRHFHPGGWVPCSTRVHRRPGICPAISARTHLAKHLVKKLQLSNGWPPSLLAARRKNGEKNRHWWHKKTLRLFCRGFHRLLKGDYVGGLSQCKGTWCLKVKEGKTIWFRKKRKKLLLVRKPRKVFCGIWQLSQKVSNWICFCDLENISPHPRFLQFKSSELDCIYCREMSRSDTRGDAHRGLCNGSATRQCCCLSAGQY